LQSLPVQDTLNLFINKWPIKTIREKEAAWVLPTVIVVHTVYWTNNYLISESDPKFLAITNYFQAFVLISKCIFKII
jgi:hypothetical protein